MAFASDKLENNILDQKHESLYSILFYSLGRPLKVV